MCCQKLERHMLAVYVFLHNHLHPPTPIIAYSYMSEPVKRKPKGKKKMNETASSSQPLPNIEDAFSAAITLVSQDQKEALRRLWDTAYELGRKHGIEEGRGNFKQPMKPKVSSSSRQNY